MKFKIGIIGSGSMGQSHSYGYDKLNEYYDDVSVEKAVICSRGITHQRAIELGWNEYENDWTKVVNRNDIDIIDISCYDSLHYPIAKAALENGKRIICEKPLANNTKQALTLVELAKGKNLTSTVCTNYRYVHDVSCIKHLVESGELGEIRHIYGSFIMDWAVNTANGMYWRLDDKICPTGALGDLGTHLIDMCRYMGLEFKEVCGMNEVYGKQRLLSETLVTTTANELCLFNARFDNEALGSFELSRVSGGGSGMIFEIHGTKGNIRWEKNNINNLLVYIPNKIANEWKYKYINSSEILPYNYKWKHKFNQKDSFTLLFHNFLSEKGNYPTLMDGLKCCEVIDSILQSDVEKRSIKIK